MNSVNGGGTKKITLEKFSRPSGHHDRLTNNKELEIDGNADEEHRPSGYEDRLGRGINLHPDATVANKVLH